MDSSATSICLEKDLIALIDNNTVSVYDNNTKIIIQNYPFKEEKIKKCLLKVDSNNNEMTYLIVTDNKGAVHVININKNEKVNKIKVHDEEIVEIKSTKNDNIIYTLDQNGVIKVTNFLSGEVKSNIRLNQFSSKSKSNEKAKFNHFDIDNEEQNIVFHKNLKIKVYNIPRNTLTKIGALSSEISSLNYSSDGKFIITSTNKDYYIYLYHKKNTKEPLITLQLNSLINSVQMKMIEKGVFHLFAMNKTKLYGYKLILDEINPNTPIQPSFEYTFPDKNLLNISVISPENTNSPQRLFILYGRALNSATIYTKTVKYSKNSKIFKEENMEITSKSKDSEGNKKGNVNVNISNVNVLNEIQMNENVENVEMEVNSTDIDGGEAKVKVDEQLSLTLGNITDEKISLVNILNNSIINNDNATFEWALDQKDHNLIESTIKKMDINLIKAFINKVTETFQSSNLFKRNLLPWLNLLFKYHLLEILKLPKKTLTGLKNLQILIQNRTKNLDRLRQVSNKLDTLINIFAKKNVTSKQKDKNPVTNPNSNYEPLLVYNESDSEDEKVKKIEGQMKKKGIKKTNWSKVKENKLEAMMNEEGEDVLMKESDMEDDFDEDLDIESEENEEDQMQVDDEAEEENSDMDEF